MLPGQSDSQPSLLPPSRYSSAAKSLFFRQISRGRLVYAFRETFLSDPSLTLRNPLGKNVSRNSTIMNTRLIRLSLSAVIAGIILAASASAQDFQKTYRIGAGGQIKIGNVSGDVIVTGYDGDSIVVTATKKGKDRDQVEVEDRSGTANVDIGARYPKHCNCDASIRFDVQVPRSIKYDFDHISSVSGDVKVTGVTGRLNASAVSGDVHITDVSGSVSASAVSGDVKVEITRLDGSDDMKFNTVSGDVSVMLPNNLDADVDMSSFSGSIKTDFAIEVKSERFGSRNSARAKLGDGSRRLKMSSVSGDLSLRHP